MRLQAVVRIACAVGPAHLIGIISLKVGIFSHHLSFLLSLQGAALNCVLVLRIQNNVTNLVIKWTTTHSKSVSQCANLHKTSVRSITG